MTQTPAPEAQPVIEILHLDEMGYGPNGSMTRRAWREACLTNLLAGKEQFQAWQKAMQVKHSKTKVVSFGLKIVNSKGLETFLDSGDSLTLDFGGKSFEAGFDISVFKILLPCKFGFVIFDGVANFAAAEFRNDVSFRRTTFRSHAKFNGTIFGNSVDFLETAFYGSAGFNNAIFEGEAWLNRISFKNLVSFKSVQFVGDAWLEGSQFQDSNDFQDAQFHSIAYFENCSFAKLGHFKKAHFWTSPPCFRGVDSSTQLSFSNNCYIPRDSISEEGVENISFLKRLSDEHGQTDQALNFNAMELRAKRLLPNADWTFKTVTWLYEVVSNYGRSFGLPLLWYGLLIWLSFIYAMGYSPQPVVSSESNKAFCKQDTEPKPLNLSYERAAFEYAMFRAGGVMDFTDTGKQNNSVNCKLFGEPIEPPVMRAWGVFKSIASIALLFLAALGLRNKYRIK